LMSYYGMGALGLLRPEVIGADIDRVIDTFGGGQNFGQMMENMGQNAFENAAIVGGRYLKIAEIVVKPFHEAQSANTPGQSTDMGDSLALSEIIKPKPATAEIPDMEPAKIILEERPMVTPKESAMLSSAPEMATTPPPQQPIGIEKPTIQTIESVAPEAQSPILPPLGEPKQPLIQTEHLVAEPPKQEDFSLRQTPSPREMPAVDLMPPKTADSLELAQKALHSDILEIYGYVNEDVPSNMTDPNGVHARLHNGQGITFHKTANGVEYLLDGQDQNEWQSINDLSDAAQTPHVPLPTTELEMATTPPPAETETPVLEQAASTESHTTELPPESTEPPIKTPGEIQDENQALAEDAKRSESYPIPPSIQPEPSLAEQSQPQPEASQQPAEMKYETTSEPKEKLAETWQNLKTTELETPVITDNTANEVIKYFEQNDYKSPLLPLLKENQQIGTLYQEVSLNVEEGNKTAAQAALDQIKSLVFDQETGQDDYNIAGTQNALIKLGFNPKDLASAANGDEKFFALAWENFLKKQQVQQTRQTAGVLLGQLQTLQAVKTYREGL